MKSDLEAVVAQALAAARAVGPVIVNITSADDSISFDYLGVSSEMAGRGLGDQAFAAVCSVADRAQVPVILSADSGFGSNLRQLVRWYSRHGFTVIAVGNAVTMRRLPTAA